jgi:hypothetical protein
MSSSSTESWSLPRSPLKLILFPLASSTQLVPFGPTTAVLTSFFQLDQTGTLNMDDETIKILYQKHILDSTSGVRAYVFLHSLLKKAKRHLHDHMPTLPSIDQATTIGSFGADLERYYLQMANIGLAFEEKPQSRFFLSALQKKCIEVDRFVDRLDSVAVNDPLPEELTRLILCIKDIHSLQPSSTADNPILVSIVRLLRPTHVGLVNLSRIIVRSLFGISVPALIHSVFADAGATLLKIVNSWPCIFFSRSICRRMPT